MRSIRLADWSGAAVRGICLALALGGLIWPAVGIAEVEARGWKSVGPAPPAIAAPIAVHLPSRTIYVSSLGGGIFKSTNGGSSFVALDNPRGYSSLALDPNDPDVVYLGFYKSTDGGATWTEMPGGGQLALVMDPTNSNVLYGVGGDIQ